MNYLAKILDSGTKTLLSGESYILSRFFFKLILSMSLFQRNLPSLSIDQIRGKKVKAKGSTRNAPRNIRPKHRGWKVQDGAHVSTNKILATQLTLRFHPGLNVGFGKNATLFALTEGRVVVTCEKFNPNWDHTWIQRIYAGREDQIIFKKYFNVLPIQQHNRFKLVDEI